MKGIEITYDQALELLQRAVNEKGADYVYFRAGASCWYFEEDGSPSCIIGHVLAYLGIKAESLPTAETNGAICKDLFRRGLLIAPDGRTTRLLQRAQSLQDEGSPWGDAVKNAVAYVNGLATA